MRTATKYRRPGPGRARPSLKAALAVVFATAVTVVGISGPAQASDISIPFDELVFGQPGSVVDIASVDVDANLVGGTCSLEVVAENQASVHKGNDLIVSTGTSQAVIFGVEDTPNGGTAESYQMVLGPTVSVQLRVGPDGMSSLGFDLSFDCVPPVVQATTPTIDQQQLQSTSTTVAATVAPAVTTNTTTCVDGSATSAGQTACSTPTTACTTAVAGGAGVDTTVAGQAVTPTTACVDGQVTGTTVVATTPTTVTPTVAGSSLTNLPQTPAAPAVIGAPAYTG